MASLVKPLLSAIFIAFITHSSFAADSTPKPGIQFSTISAAPAVLPGPPLSSESPALSPDITPLFPSPRKEPLSPSESSLPTIPSSPSPPNPDAVVSPGPGIALPPTGSLITSASASSPSRRPLSSVALFVVLVGFFRYLVV